ncbi:hypothetical protein HK44_018785 [Pseudomonas fluorescens HK44]|uniref:Uncharacterized protein n=1 Tax=Pseudomonas fluorescens HK44 TaxID=1042209 RepID=A0A010RF24_PSEFL|nr:hypothetical protein HK44_018785 [Pseudomonas fluorescens HK44]
MLLLLQILQVPVLLTYSIPHGVQQLQTRSLRSNPSHCPQIRQRQVFDWWLLKKQKAKRNVSEIRPLLSLKECWFGLASFPFLYSITFHWQLFRNLLSGEACTLSRPCEQAGID